MEPDKGFFYALPLFYFLLYLGNTHQQMTTFLDQLGRNVFLPNTPSRIISLVPSQTELLYYLGLSSEVVGITKFCVHPADWFKTKERVGGTKNVNLQKVKALHPHLILANKEENEKEQVIELEKDFPVWVSDIDTLEDALEMIHSVGSITGKEEKSLQLVTDIKANFQKLIKYKQEPIRVAYLIWNDPYMTVGKNTFINDMLGRAGFQNVFDIETRYPQIELSLIKEKCPQVLFLSTEPYPFTEKHIYEMQLHLPATKIMLVDGELFSWYGSRLLQSPAYFQSLHNQLTS